MEEGDLTEEDEDDEDGIRFVTLESRVENKETVLNRLTISTKRIFLLLQTVFPFSA